jgi:hypothetical protein
MERRSRDQTAKVVRGRGRSRGALISEGIKALTVCLAIDGTVQENQDKAFVATLFETW